MMKNFSVICLTLALLFTLAGCDDRNEDESGFSYNTILNREFRNNVGRIIPVAYEKAIETGGDMSTDGKFLYYSSNRENGNFDIYLRNLQDITTVRLTGHAAKDTQPAISPDGKYLAYVSSREDPEGDIYVVKIKPEKLVSRAKSSVTGVPTVDSDAKNLSQFTDSASGTVKIVRDADPAWSPDGKTIAFTSGRNGMDNIWLMKRDGRDLRQLTRMGGLYPRFSPDGKKIIFIAYRKKDSRGDVYIMDLDSGKEEMVDLRPGLKLYPSFMGTGDEIMYTLTPADTNGDGAINLNDDSVIMYCNLKTGAAYPLTLQSNSSFDSRLVMTPWAGSHEGILIFSDIRDGNINVNIIPGYGIIPRKPRASAQYQLALSYSEELDDTERYIMALKRVWYFHGSRKDPESQIYSAKSVAALWRNRADAGDRQGTAEALDILKSLANKGNSYVKAQYDIIAGASGWEKTAADLNRYIRESSSDRESRAVTPYLMEDLAGLYKRNGKTEKALSLLAEIKKNYPGYEEISSVHLEFALITEGRPAQTLSDSAVYTLENGRNVQKVRMNNHMIALFEKQPPSAVNLALMMELAEKYKDKKRVRALFQYLAGRACLRMNRREKALAVLEDSAKISNINDVIHYRARVMLAGAYLDARDMNSAEKNMALAVTSYKRYFRDADYRGHVQWLIGYYEERGGAASQNRQHQAAAAMYSQYRKLIKYIFAYKFFPELYSVHGPRAHTLYIDAIHSWKREAGLDELSREYLGDLDKARIESDKAYVYAVAYLHTLKALENRVDQGGGDWKLMLSDYRIAVENLDWALFIDDSFIDPCILKSWIYQHLDLIRSRDSAGSPVIDRYFPTNLWEKNIDLLKRALSANDESLNPGSEGAIHLNLGNNYFLLSNFPEALKNYRLAGKYGLAFNSRVQEAIFRFHLGYCLWQNGEIGEARSEIAGAEKTYRDFSAGGNEALYKDQLYTLYRYNALFARMSGDYAGAVDSYRKILSFTEKHGIDIDRARYMQEIAHCYQEMKQYDMAIDYLNRAETLLEEYPEKEKKYRMGFSMFGIFTLHMIDLGLDGAVIGENKIFSELDTRNKKLLNLAMFEEIMADRSDYAGAVRYLEKKIAFLENRKPSVDRESLIITYNNLGYYHVLMKDYEKALVYFNKAWDTASQHGFLQGSFSAIMNLASLHASLLERDPARLENPSAAVAALLKRIGNYRESYERDTLKQRLDKLQADAEKQKRQVTQKEKDDLRDQVASQAREIYYRSDIAMGVLIYYQAELKSRDLKLPDLSAAGDAFRIYRDHMDIFSLYRQALEKFQTAHRIAQTEKKDELSVKLLMNIGACQSRTGALDDAYVAFIDARDLAEQLRSQPLVFSASMALGLFLKEQGRQVEGKDHLGLALASLRRSLECVRAAPLLYTDRAGRVESLYEAIRDICLALEQWQAAFDYDEEKTAFLKIALVHNESPRFHSPEHRKAYDRYTGLNRNIETDYSVIRRLASRGLSIESPEMKKAMSRLEVDRKSLEDFVAEIQKIEPELSPFMILVRNDRPAPEGTAAVKLLETGGVTRAWIVQGKKTVHVSMKTGDYGPLAQAIKRMDRKRGIFVILSPEALKWIREDSASLRDIPVSMALSMEEASNWALENNRRQVRSILYIEKGRKGLMDLPSGIREYEKGETDITGCDIIIDSINSPAFNAGNLFNTRIRPALLLSKASDQESILKIAMAARYSGVSSLILFRDGEKTDLKALLDRLLREGGTSIIQSDLASPGLILLGAPLMPPSGAHDSAGLIRSTRDRYLEFMKRGRYADARIELNRWKSLSGDGIQTRRLYLDGMINLLLLQGKLTEAESLAGSAAGEDASVYSLFLKLYSGDIKAARSIIETSSVIRESREYPVFRGILDLLSGAEAHSVMKSLEDFISEGRTSGGPEKGSRISVERMLLLLSDYLDLTENGDESRRALSAMENMQGLSEREAIFMFTLDRTGLLSLEPSAKSPLIRAFLEDYRKGSMSFGAMTERIRSLSDEAEVPAALLLLLASRDDRRKNAFLSELAQWPLLRETLDRARWTDRLRLERMLALRLEASGETQKAHAYTESFLKAADERGIAPLRREAMTRGARELTAMKRFEQAHAIAREAETFTPENHKLHMPLQFVLLDCETSAVNPDAGMVRAEKLLAGKNLSRPDNFTLLLFRARIELKKLAAMKAPEKKDGRSMELLYMEILKVIDSHPQLLAGLERRYLLEEIADAYINYMMRTGDMSSALNYAEVKKHLLTRMDYSWRISGGAAKNFTATGIQAELRANPGLVMERVIPQLPLDVIRKRIPERAMILYSVRNGNSVFVWALGRDFRFATVLENRAAALEDISAAFSRNESDQAGVSGLSRRLMEIFSPVKEYIRRSETVYICADRFMEKVPFEIMGERQILWETHSVLFLSSLTFSLRSLQTGGRELTLHGGSLDERSAVEKTAISESGVRWHPGNPGGSMIHFLNPLVYEADKRRIMAASEDYSVAAAGKKSVCALIPVSEEGFALYSAALGISSCLINRASARDFNSPRFLERYYREISSGATAREAFDRARAALLARHEFGNQASGAFVRLYLNGI